MSVSFIEIRLAELKAELNHLISKELNLGLGAIKHDIRVSDITQEIVRWELASIKLYKKTQPKRS